MKKVEVMLNVNYNSNNLKQNKSSFDHYGNGFNGSGEEFGFDNSKFSFN